MAGLLEAMVKAAERTTGGFKHQEDAAAGRIDAWAAERCLGGGAQSGRVMPGRLFEALARAAERCLDDFETVAGLLEALARMVERCGSNITDAVSVDGIHATAGQIDTELFEALARTAERRMGAFDSQEAANTAWAFAAAVQIDTELFGAWVGAGERRMSDSDPQAIAGAAWAFAAAGLTVAELHKALATWRRCTWRCRDDFNPQNVTTTASAFETARQLFEALARAAERRMGGQTFAYAGQTDAELREAWIRAVCFDSFEEPPPMGIVCEEGEALAAEALAKAWQRLQDGVSVVGRLAAEALTRVAQPGVRSAIGGLAKVVQRDDQLSSEAGPVEAPNGGRALSVMMGHNGDSSSSTESQGSQPSVGLAGWISIFQRILPHEETNRYCAVPHGGARGCP